MLTLSPTAAGCHKPPDPEFHRQMTHGFPMRQPAYQQQPVYQRQPAYQRRPGYQHLRMADSVGARSAVEEEVIDAVRKAAREAARTTAEEVERKRAAAEVVRKACVSRRLGNGGGGVHLSQPWCHTLAAHMLQCWATAVIILACRS